jgi:uncharacterized protein
VTSSGLVVVADSSPLIYLSRIGALHLLHRLFDSVVVPRTVWVEVVEHQPHAPGVDVLQQAEWIRVVETAPPEIELGLDPGETAAILLAEAMEADLLLIDERNGRNVAQSRGITVRGTLGVLVQARLTGAVPALRPVVNALVAEGFRVAPSLIRRALVQVGEQVEADSPPFSDRS